MSKDKSPLVDLPVSTPSHSYADWSHDNTFTTNFGYLVPTTCRQILPGTGVKWRSSHFGRLAPMLSPVYGKVNIFSYRFVIRNRDIATYWDSLITNGDQRLTWQQNETSFVPPVISQFKPLDLLLNGYFLPQIYLTDDNQNHYFKSVSEDYSSPSDVVTMIHNNFSTVSVPNDISTYSNGNMKLNPGLYKSELIYVYKIVLNNGEFSTELFRYDVNKGIDFDPYTIVLLFRPNYSELNTENQSFTYPLTKALAEFYIPNPFSSGTLLDYLGIDLKQYYNSNAEYWADCLGCLLSTWTSSNPLKVNIDEARNIVRTFAKNHFVYAIYVNANNTSAPFSTTFKYQSMNVLGYIDAGTIYTMENSTTTTSPYTNLIQDAFFNGSANRTYGNRVVPFSSERLSVNMLPIHAYNFVYNEWFRDQNLIPINTNCRFDVQGDFLATFMPSNTMNSYGLAVLLSYFHLKKKAWEKDAFTTSLPGPQRGTAVRYLANPTISFKVNSSIPNRIYNNSQSQIQNASTFGTGSTGNFLVSNSNAHLDNTKDLLIDLSQATIENFRWANKMQEFLEIKARTGNRYFEMMQGLWGVDIDDAKINRPIYMDGSKTPIQISEVLQTSSTDVSTGQPLGDMAGRATAVGGSDQLDWLQKDWAIMMEIICVVPRVSYMRGLDKMWTRTQYLDWPWFKFAQLGEETVDKRELLFDGTNEERPFGYQSRYYDWKLINDSVHGEFKDSLDFWHFARDFDSYPQLGQSFIEVDPPYRQFAVTDKHYHHVWLSVSHDISVHQPLPHLPVPSL